MRPEVGNRIRIKTLISLLPGLHLRQLQRLVHLSFNSTRYHVQVLAKNGEIVRAEQGGYSRLYPVGLDNSDKVLFSLLRRTTNRRILACILKTKKTSLRQLCELTGLAKSTVSEHLTELVGTGVVLVRSVNQARAEYELTNPAQLKALISSEKQALLRKATDNFIEMWDF